PLDAIVETIQETIIETKKPAFDSTKLSLNFKAKGDYNVIKSNIVTKKRGFKTEYNTNKNKAITDASAYLHTTLLNAIVPHWYGTTWEFSGHTNIPNNGEIACGYFVSTTLRHLDFKVNRYKMAQQAGMNIAIALQPKNKLKIYSGLDFKALKEKLNAVYKNGIYFVGLDNHVGYVLIKDKEIYFLHSSYCDNKVVIELAEKSPCFRSNLYVFAEITTNNTLVRKWILSEQLIIPTN
uniref:hypothetical protein n=1 Tax=Lacinutrix sp. TaxID=1937692 RepID=UPI0025BB19A7